MQPAYVDALDADAIALCARQTHALWGGGRTLDQHVSDTFEQLTRGGDLLRFVGLHDGAGTLVCSLKRYHAMLSSPAGAVHAVGIGALFTPEEHRRQGYATLLVRMVIDRARAEGYGAALLYSDIDPRFYEKLGFVLLPHPTWMAAAGDLPRDAGLEMTPCNEPTRLLAIHESSFAPSWVRMLRNETGWRLAAWRQRSAASILLVENERAAGYVIASKHDDLLWVADEALPDMPRERLWATLRRLAEQAGTARVAGWLRADHAGGPFVPQPRSCCIPMVAPFDERLAPIANLPTHLSSFDHF